MGPIAEEKYIIHISVNFQQLQFAKVRVGLPPDE